MSGQITWRTAENPNELLFIDLKVDEHLNNAD